MVDVIVVVVAPTVANVAAVIVRAAFDVTAAAVEFACFCCCF